MAIARNLKRVKAAMVVGEVLLVSLSAMVCVGNCMRRDEMSSQAQEVKIASCTLFRHMQQTKEKKKRKSVIRCNSPKTWPYKRNKNKKGNPNSTPLVGTPKMFGQPERGQNTRFGNYYEDGCVAVSANLWCGDQHVDASRYMYQAYSFMYGPASSGSLSARCSSSVVHPPSWYLGGKKRRSPSFIGDRTPLAYQ